MVSTTVEISDDQAGVYSGTPVADAVVQGAKLTATPVAVPPATPNPRKIVVDVTNPSSLQTGGCPQLYLYDREADSKTFLNELHLNAAGEYTADPNVPAATRPCAGGPWSGPVTVLDTVHDDREQTAVVWRALGAGGKWVFLAASYRLAQSGGGPTQEEDAYERCKQDVRTPIPEVDKLASVALDAMTCNSEALYDGIDEPPNFEMARACAFREREAGLDQVTPFRGVDILAMIYANGKGVPHNRALARKFVCETQGRDTYHLLDELTPSDGASAPATDADEDGKPAQFDICDAGSSGPTQMFDECTARGDLIDESQYAAKAMPMAAAWPAAQKKSLRDLLHTAYTFLVPPPMSFRTRCRRGQV